MSTLPVSPPIPADLLAASPPAASVFLDTNATTRTDFVLRLAASGPPLISAVVFAERLRKRPQARWAEYTLARLRDLRIRVVPFAAEDALAFWELCRRLEFGAAPLRRDGESERACFERLRFDLLVFAVALRHRRLLITDNTTDFVHFPFPAWWQSRADYAAARNWPA